MYFKNCTAIFKLLEKFTVFFLSPMPRYLYMSCCKREDHAPNIREDMFEDSMRRSLIECRGYYKDFFSLLDSRMLQFSTLGLRYRARTRQDCSCGVRIRFIRFQKDTTG